MKIRGVIIAAGESSRLGSPKALLNIHGRSILDRLHRTLRAGGCDEVMVVGGGTHCVAVQEEADRIGVPLVINHDPSDGPVSSIRTNRAGNLIMESSKGHPMGCACAPILPVSGGRPTGARTRF